MTESNATLLQAVSELATLTASAALQYYRKGIAVEVKGDGSPVTVADRSAEHVARSWLARNFPGDGILGEEFGEDRGDNRRRWLIDPIDGTKSFVRHVPLWGTLIAVEENGKVLAGAACYPVVDETIAASVGEGCWHNGGACRVSELSVLSSATILTTDDRFKTSDVRRAAWRDLADRVYLSRTWGDCFGYLMVATGRAEAMVDEVVSAWDAACFQPIVEEAGGVLTDFRGDATPFGGSLIATNSALATGIREILCDH
jgi:histidinol-phosphatase